MGDNGIKFLNGGKKMNDRRNYSYWLENYGSYSPSPNTFPSPRSESSTSSQVDPLDLKWLTITVKRSPNEVSEVWAREGWFFHEFGQIRKSREKLRQVDGGFLDLSVINEFKAVWLRSNWMWLRQAWSTTPSICSSHHPHIPAGYTQDIPIQTKLA